MYDHTENQLLLPSDFFLPFGGTLNPDNRWIRLAQLIPWGKAEAMYKEKLKDVTQGAHAYSVRMALGALIIKERLGTSDQETVEQIAENPYLQYFLGLAEYQETCPFDVSSLTYFRRRIDAEMIAQVNDWVTEAASTPSSDEEEPPDDDSGGEGSSTASSEGDGSSQQPRYHQGKLLIDATCAPADIAYPTDLNLLNHAREKLETMIDTLHEYRSAGSKKPRTYRRKARKQYLMLAKQRQPGGKKRRKAIRQQLHHVKRDLGHLRDLVRETTLAPLSCRQYRDLFVIQELYRQQQQMYEEKKRRIDDRIVSIQQPYVRPMVRGKAHAAVEFGAKLSVVVTDGWAKLDRLTWDAYHEAADLPRAVEAYHDRYGFYPEAVLGDQLYRTRANRQFCKERGIRLSGPKLGRPPKHSSIEEKRQTYQDACDRNAVEGKFGEGKRAYGLGLIQARRKDTSETVIALQILQLNLAKALRELPVWCGWMIERLLFSDRNVSTDRQGLWIFKRVVVQ